MTVTCAGTMSGCENGEAILSHIEVLLMDGESVSKRRPLEKHQANEDYADDVWALVDADVSKLLGERVRV